MSCVGFIPFNHLLLTNNFVVLLQKLSCSYAGKEASSRIGETSSNGSETTG